MRKIIIYGGWLSSRVEADIYSGSNRVEMQNPEYVDVEQVAISYRMCSNNFLSLNHLLAAVSTGNEAKVHKFIHTDGEPKAALTCQATRPYYDKRLIERECVEGVVDVELICSEQKAHSFLNG